MIENNIDITEPSVSQVNQPEINRDNLSKKKNLKYVVLLLLLIVLGVIGFLLYQNFQLKKQILLNQNNPSVDTSQQEVNITNKPIVSEPTDSTVPTIDVTENWLTFGSKDNLASFKYPKELQNLFSSSYFKDFGLIAQSQQEITSEFESLAKTYCPPPCAEFVDNPDLLQKQFVILEEVSKLPNCQLTESLKGNIEENFILYSQGVHRYYYIDTIKNQNGDCGLKLVDFSGYDVSLGNFRYMVVFSIQDKIVKFNTSLFPLGTDLENVNSFWKDIGYERSETNNWSCDGDCSQKEGKYYENFNVNNEFEKEMIKMYDQVSSTIYLVK